MTGRKTLPFRRLTETFELVHADKPYTVSIGFFDYDRPVMTRDDQFIEHVRQPAEVFISNAKAGSDVEAVARDGAVILSIAMQYDVPLAVLGGAITRTQDGKPMSIIGAVVDRLMKET